MQLRFITMNKPQNPIMQGLYFVLAAVLAVGAFFVGAFLLMAALAVGLVFALVIMGRVWWIRRKLGKFVAGQSPGVDPGAGVFGGGFSGRSTSSSQSRVIDVEYTVVEESDSDSSADGNVDTKPKPNQNPDDALGSKDDAQRR